MISRIFSLTYKFVWSCSLFFDRKYLGSISHDQMLKLWDLDDLLQGSGSTLRGREAMADSDSDEMDVDAKGMSCRTECQ
ncbi:hypothetical protein CK203_049158 [Vitis vinifera]|uniref:Uncharacterized protein n=1 Tax=Vitis vinifera TaxID=29760 RepID=A0A438GV61_VITVI|nr:hypothetical protein CK203_049158 [Vitis vinifera]